MDRQGAHGVVDGVSLVTDRTGASTRMGEKVELASASLRLAYDLDSGTVDLFGTPSTPLLLNATAAAILPRQVVLASDARYHRQSHRGAPMVAGLTGDQLVVTCRDTQQQVDLECRFTLLRKMCGALFEVVLTNVSSHDLVVCAAEPMRARLDELSGCFFGADRVYSRVQRVLRNGYLYSDPGEVIDMAWQGRRDMTSCWNAAFHIPATQETLVVGYLDNQQAEGQIRARWDMSQLWRHGQPAFDLTARSLYNRTFRLRPGQPVRSGRCMVLLTPEPFAGLEYYAELTGRLHHVRLNPILHGWCSWPYTHAEASEDEQLANAEFIARHLKPYGLEWVQIDDGYQRTFGDWQGNHLYPHGMPWLATQIRRLGLKPGLWIAPYAIAEPAPLLQQHPEWLAHDATGALQETASTRARYILDITHPGAQQWLWQLCDTMTRDWGYDFLKIDFVEWTLLAIRHYHDTTMSRAQAYRRGFAIMRAAIGPQRHLLDCGPGPETVGLLDSMRIEQDLPRPTWEQYVTHSSSTAPAMAKRYYFHRRTWINDADHLCLGLLTVPQAQTVATLIALSGGTVMLGDRLPALDAARLAILTKVLPTYGAAARPLDLFETDRPALFLLPVHSAVGAWWLLGYFHWDEAAEATRTLALSRLGLPPEHSYLVYTFWTQQLLADGSDTVTLRFPPATVHLLAIHPKQPRPQVLSTDRHYTQGAIELAEVRWDARQNILSGLALGAPGQSWSLTIYVPAGFAWDGGTLPAPSSSAGVVVVQAYEPPLLRLQLTFAGTDRLPWAVQFLAAGVGDGE